MKNYYNVWLKDKKELTEIIVYAGTPREAKKIFVKQQELKATPSQIGVKKLLQQ